jgi:glutamate-5-semialdehyde dehydrogenase
VTVEQTCAASQRASRVLAGLTRARKDEALRAVADALDRRSAEILAENDEDLRLARKAKLEGALIDRLRLDEDRLADVAASVRTLAALPDPVGQIVDGWRLENGIEVRRVRVPLGVIAVIYESRPNVTVDAACLCLKTGNAVILRGGSAALHSNRILSEVVQGALLEANLPREAVSYLAPDREQLDELLQQRRYVDLIIPRGGEQLKDYLMENSKVPVI